jgi:hypothetical protein
LAAKGKERVKATNSKFKWQKTIHRHGPILIPNDCWLSEPPNFSLLSTFKNYLLILELYQETYGSFVQHFPKEKGILELVYSTKVRHLHHYPVRRFSP